VGDVAVELGAKQEREHLLMRELHPMCIARMPLDTPDEFLLVIRSSLETAVAPERLVHSCLGAENVVLRLEDGKLASSTRSLESE
jgi:hypothetical protein